LLAEGERLLAALVFAPPLLDALDLLPPLLFAVAPERGLLFDALLVFAPLPLFEALERRAELLEPLELWELFFCRLDEPVFACAMSPPWVFDNFGLKNWIPRLNRAKRFGAGAHDVSQNPKPLMRRRTSRGA
jgi:hypothetical protein